MQKSNISLHSARIKKSWTREFVSQKVGVSLNTYIRWEMGQQTPRPASLQALCEVFAMSPEELGFDEVSDEKADSYVEQEAPRSGAFPVPSQTLPAHHIPVSVESWAESIEVCWQVYMQGAQEEIEKQLPDYFRSLKGPALLPDITQSRAAHILSQAYQLQALLKLQRADYASAHASAAQAIIHSHLCNDWNIYIAAQLRMAYILSCHKETRIALHTYHEALRRINSTPHYISPLLHSWTFAGIGAMCATLGSEKEATQYLQLAMATFPDQPEEDMAYPYTHHNISLLILHEGLILLRLGQPQLAWEAFAHIEQLQPDVPKRVRLEFLYYRANTSLALGKMIQCCIYLEATVKVARELKSTFFLNESYLLYEQMLLFWGQEARVRTLAKLFP